MANLKDTDEPTTNDLLIELIETNQAVVIMLMRLYDLEMTAARHNLGSDIAAKLEQLHTEGGILSPYPYLRLEDEDKTNDA